MFLSFSKFRIVYKAGIEISRQFWNRISPFFLKHFGMSLKLQLEICSIGTNHEVRSRQSGSQHSSSHSSLRIAARLTPSLSSFEGFRRSVRSTQCRHRPLRRKQTNAHRSLHCQQTALTDCSCTKLQSAVAGNAFVHFEALELTGTHLRNEWYGRSS